MKGRTHNMGLAAMLADEKILIFLFAIMFCSSLTFFNIALSCYLNLW